MLGWKYTSCATSPWLCAILSGQISQKVYIVRVLIYYLYFRLFCIFRGEANGRVQITPLALPTSTNASMHCCTWFGLERICWVQLAKVIQAIQVIQVILSQISKSLRCRLMSCTHLNANASGKHVETCWNMLKHVDFLWEPDFWHLTKTMSGSLRSARAAPLGTTG